MLSQIVYDFEAAHQKGDEPRLQDFVPADARDHTTILAELVRIDLEYRCKRGESIRVDAYLTPFPELVHDQDFLLEVIEAEFRARQSQGEQPAVETYVQRFSTLAERLDSRLSALTGESADTASNALSASAPPQVPGYELLSVLGEGGMGIVYQARHLALDRLVALKMIKGGAHLSADDGQRFRTEAEAVARLQHPNIVQIHEIGSGAGLPFFTLEYCAGGSLASKLNGTPLPAPEAARLAEILAHAMAAAHQKQIIHRDLKPHNVLLTEDGTPKITDFGLAKKLDTGTQQTQSGAIVGTPSYMAPEQARGDLKAVGPLADVYALGAILYEMLTGRPPFRGTTSLDTILQVLDDDPVPPRQLQPKLPRDLETICLKCLHKEPGQRYASAAAVADYVRRFRDGEAIVARPAGRLEQGWRWCRRHPATAGWVAAVGVLVLAGLGAAFRYQQDQLDRVAAQARQEQAEAEIGRALAEAARPLDEVNDRLKDRKKAQELLNRPARWLVLQLESRAALKRAQALLGNLAAEAAAALRQQERELQQRWEGMEEDRRRAERLDHIRQEASMMVDGKIDQTRAGPSYAEELQRLGLEPAQDDPQAMAWLRGSRLRLAVVAALDHWATVAKSRKLRERLMQLASAADPDPWGDRLLDPNLEWEDQRTLEKLAAETDLAAVTPSLLQMLAMRLQKAGTAARLLRQALLHHPEDFWLNFQLASLLDEQARDEAAAAAFRKAIDLDPTYPVAYHNLALTLHTQKDFAGAVAALLKATQLQPTFAEAYCVLGLTLRKQGDFAKARAALERGHELGCKRPNWSYPSGQWLKEDRRLQELEGKLASFLSGKSKPASVAEGLELALLCKYKGLTGASTCFFEKFLEDTPRPTPAQVYQAACVAALAGCGKGQDDPAPNEKERGRWRQKSLEWLRAALVSWNQTAKANPKARDAIAANLLQWQWDPDLAGVRGEVALAQFPAAERQSWQQLWTEAAALLEHVRRKPG